MVVGTFVVDVVVVGERTLKPTPHQRRRAKITDTVRQTLERSILSSIKKFDGSVKKWH